MPRLQDLPDISSTLTKNDKLLIIRNDSQGLATLNDVNECLRQNEENEDQ